MKRPYVHNSHNMFIVLPTIAIGRIGSVWFIEAAWLRMAVGVIITI